MLFFFFFNDTATTEIYTLSLHDALPIYGTAKRVRERLTSRLTTSRSDGTYWILPNPNRSSPWLDRKSTRLNSSHSQISYAVFCLKKKKKMLLVMYYSIPVHVQGFKFDEL